VNASTGALLRRYYDLVAPEYDDWYLGRGRFGQRDAAAWDAELARLTATIAELPPLRTLDVACGTGYLTRHVPGDVVGLDASAAMLEVARRQAPRATYVQGDALALPFDDRSFGRVLSAHFYGHLDESERGSFVGEARRVAEELVIVDAAIRPNHAEEETQHRLLADGSSWPILKRYFTTERLVAELGAGEVLHSGGWFVAVRTRW